MAMFITKVNFEIDYPLLTYIYIYKYLYFVHRECQFYWQKMLFVQNQRYFKAT